MERLEVRKVITYGTFDLLHYGHINLLERAKALGDYLVVGVTTENFDMNRGKLNVQQSLMERIQAVKDTGLVDEVIPEEYVGQKIDDIQRYDIDVFAIGSDWEGKFEYLKEYCNVVYLDRTNGVSSTELRLQSQTVRIGIVGYLPMVDKFIKESKYVSNVVITGLCIDENQQESKNVSQDIPYITNDIEALIEDSDAIYVISDPSMRYTHVKRSLEKGKHVLCESPITLSREATTNLFRIAEENNCVLFEALKTAYSTAFSRLVLLVKSGEIGRVKLVESTCTSLRSQEILSSKTGKYGSLTAWGPIALLPIFKILGTNYTKHEYISMNDEDDKDLFTKINFIYPNAIASLKVGIAVKSEGDLIVSGTKGYIYVPSPWWKTDYFEVRYEDFSTNKRYFYKLEGEGIRYEIAAFAKAIYRGKSNFYIDNDISTGIASIMQDYFDERYKKYTINYR